MKKILIIDDDLDMCRLLSHYLQRKGFETDTAHTGGKGLSKFKESNFEMVLCDFRLGDMNGKEVLQEIKKINAEAIVIIITGYSDVKMAVEIIRHGGFDYITKPLIPEEVINVINRAFAESSENNDELKKYPDNTQPKSNNLQSKDEYLVGISPRTVELYKQVDLVAPTNYSVILYGESGTGKEVMAKIIHQKSKRNGKPFLPVDCGTLSRELAASELFGHVKGSFTGALADKEGFFEAADGGTLFLDEIANLPVDVQTTLLRVVQERKFKRVGSNKDITTDVRVIVASNENLREACQKGKFREDLYHRFNEFSISIPPLRERKDDIQLFADFFLKKVSKELNKPLEKFDDEVMQLFLEYNWPGNLREIKNVIRRAGLLSSGGVVTANTLPWEIIGNPLGLKNTVSELSKNQSSTAQDKPRPVDLKDAATQAEYETIMNVLKEVKFNKTKAAEVLKIDRKTLYNKIRNYEESNSIKEME
ncbi:MAG: sigma-54 dependent transcriptional regulator [Chitinophagaceae bacterium]